ncbi:MAG: YciI family protein [Chloroflexota bacterium]
MDAKEAIGGYGILEAADLDEALAVVRTFPVPDGKAEVRAVIER